MAKRKIWPNRKELAQNKENIWRNGSTGFESGSTSAKANDVSSWVGCTRNGIVPCVGWPLRGSRGTKIKTTLKMYVNMLLTLADQPLYMYKVCSNSVLCPFLRPPAGV
jgi:hypothetical protein